MERHEYEPCSHEGRHGYTLRGEAEHEMCERCRRGPEAHIEDRRKAFCDTTKHDGTMCGAPARFDFTAGMSVPGTRGETRLTLFSACGTHSRPWVYSRRPYSGH